MHIALQKKFNANAVSIFFKEWLEYNEFSYPMHMKKSYYLVLIMQLFQIKILEDPSAGQV